MLFANYRQQWLWITKQTTFTIHNPNLGVRCLGLVGAELVLILVIAYNYVQ